MKLYLHPETGLTTKPIEEIEFVGKSYPNFALIRGMLADQIGEQYPQLPPHRAPIDQFRRVHTGYYIDSLLKMAAGEKVDDIRTGMECFGLEH